MSKERRKYRVPRHQVTQPLDKPYRFIPLTQGQTAIVDAEDFDRVNRWNWHALKPPLSKTFYAVRLHTIAKGTRIVVSMHGFILKTGNKELDHLNADTLDNRKTNLRKATRSQNCCNRGRRSDSHSKFKGAFFRKNVNKWQSSITIKKKRHYLGQFFTPEEAARAYDEKAKEFHGEFAHLNFPSSN